MTSGRIRQVDPQTLPDAPLRAALFVDVATDHLHPEGYLAIMRGDAAAAGKGRFIGNLNGAPNITEHDERYEPFDGTYGLSGDILGNQQIDFVRNEISFSLISLTLENLKLIRPDCVFSIVYGADAVAASTTRGAGNAQVTVTANATGVGGNDIRLAFVIAGNNTPLSVTVDTSGATDDITVNVATDGTGAATSTATQVRNAINASSAAAALVTASLPAGSDGSSVVAASAMAALTGGVDGTQVGVRITRRANIAVTDYRTNFVCVWSNSDKTVGGAYIIRKAINVNEDKEYGFSDDGTVFGVDVTMRAHIDGTTLDLETGVPLPNFEEHKYGSGLVIPA